LILFNYNDLAKWVGVVAPSAGVTNAFFYQAKVGVKPTDKLDIMGTFTYATADKVVANMSKNYGYEIDVTGTYKITNNLSYMLGVGYLLTGDYFKGTGANNSVTNDYLVINKLTLNKGVGVADRTKVVPIISIGNGNYAGAAQISGPASQVDQVNAVAMLEASMSGKTFRIKALIPVSSKDVIKELKRVTSVWIKQRDPALVDFAWQNGYGVYSVSASNADKVRAYIAELGGFAMPKESRKTAPAEKKAEYRHSDVDCCICLIYLLSDATRFDPEDV
jgi:hypothetical protein